jgi:hypothetical protein
MTTLNPQPYLKDIGDAVKEFPGFTAAVEPANAFAAPEGCTVPPRTVGAAAFRTMAVAGGARFTAGRALPLPPPAGWSAPVPLGRHRQISGPGADGRPFHPGTGPLPPADGRP